MGSRWRGTIKRMPRLQPFKYELMFDGAQRHPMARYAGSCRYVYNKALELHKVNFEAGGKFIGEFQRAKLLTQRRTSVSAGNKVPATTVSRTACWTFIGATRLPTHRALAFPRSAIGREETAKAQFFHCVLESLGALKPVLPVTKYG